MADNQARKEWNQVVDKAPVESVLEPDIKEIKKTEIAKKVWQSITVNGRNTELFLQIIIQVRAINESAN